MNCTIGPIAKHEVQNYRGGKDVKKFKFKVHTHVSTITM